MLSSRVSLGLLVLCAFASLASASAAIHSQALLLGPATLSVGSIRPGNAGSAGNAGQDPAALVAPTKSSDAVDGGANPASYGDIGPEVVIPEILSRITSYHLLNNLGLVHPDCRATPTSLACTINLPYAIFTDEVALVLDIMQVKGLPEMANARDESPDVDGGFVIGFGLGCSEPNGLAKLTDNGSEAQGMAAAMGGKECVKVVIREKASAPPADGGMVQAASVDPGSPDKKSKGMDGAAGADSAASPTDSAATPTDSASSHTDSVATPSSGATDLSSAPADNALPIVGPATGAASG